MAGYKTWAADDVLAAADLNSYLMAQAVPRFADTSTRSGAILSPAEGQLTYRIDGDVYELWNGSAWVALGSAIGTATSATTAASADKLNGRTVFVQSATPTALATGDLWFW